MRRIRSLVARLDERSALWREIEALPEPVLAVQPAGPPGASSAEMRAFFGKAARHSRR